MYSIRCTHWRASAMVFSGLRVQSQVVIESIESSYGTIQTAYIPHMFSGLMYVSRASIRCHADQNASAIKIQPTATISSRIIQPTTYT
jgi:hypothetical protein